MKKTIPISILDQKTQKFADWLVKENRVSEPQIEGVSGSMLLLVYASEEQLHIRDDMVRWGLNETQWRDAVWWALDELERRAQVSGR